MLVIFCIQSDILRAQLYIQSVMKDTIAVRYVNFVWTGRWSAWRGTGSEDFYGKEKASALDALAFTRKNDL